MEKFPENYEFLRDNLTDEEKKNFIDESKSFERELILRFAKEKDNYTRDLKIKYKNMIESRLTWRNDGFV